MWTQCSTPLNKQSQLSGLERDEKRRKSSGQQFILRNQSTETLVITIVFVTKDFAVKSNLLW